MNKLGEVFNRNRKALIAYITAGYPNIETTSRLISLLAESGCDIIEIGVPFSDPLADGTTIQKASHLALEQGITVSACLDIARKASAAVAAPLVFMTYYNPIFNYGLDSFCRDTAAASVSGIIVPDLPPDEGADMEAAAVKHGLSLIYLLAPTSDDSRIELVSSHSEGFIYLVSLAGVTGARTSLSADLGEFVGRVRRQTDKPLCVGFGISSPEQAKAVAGPADGIIVGSRILELVEADLTLESLRNFISSLRSAIDSL